MMLGSKQSPSANMLQTLALAAMHSKFERRPMPSQGLAPRLSVQPAEYPNMQARKAMLRLLAGRDGNVTDSMAATIPALLRQHSLALHPFDYAKLESFIARHVEELSATERDWLRLIRPERTQTDEPYLNGPVTEAHFMLASKSQRINFLRELRNHDPKRSRELIEAVLPSEPADMRLHLLKAIGGAPTIADQPFLESLLKDRAPSVRDYAQSLLNQFPGTENHARQIARLKEDLVIKTEGILRRKKVLVYKGPEQKSDQDRFGRLLTGLRLADIANALSEDLASVFTMAMQSEKLSDFQMLLLHKAVDEREFVLARKACEQLNSEDGVLLQLLIDEKFADRPTDDRTAILQLCFTPRLWKKLPTPWILQLAASRIPSLLPDDIARPLLEHPGWAQLGETEQKATFDAVAHLVPSSLSAPFMQMAEAIAPRAALYHRFILSLSQ
jgi:hypothetical protein